MPTACPATDQDLYFEAEDARLRYRDAGAGAVVLLLHGWTLDLDQWEPQAAALAGSFRVVRLDRRGFGLSSGRPDLAADGADVRALCRHLGLRAIALVGMSQAARVAVRLAAEAPQLLRCLVLDGPPAGIAGAPWAGRGDAPLAEFRRLASEQGMPAFRRAWAAHRLLKLHTDDAAAREVLERMIGRYRGEDLLGPAPLTGEAPALESIRMPALVITGQHDIEARCEAADVIARRLPAARRAIVPGAGHLAGLDNPRAYNALLLDFLEATR